MNGPITTEETNHVSNILKHYAHAKEKHPYFCDWAGPDASNAKDREKVDMCLGRARERLASATRCNKVGWDDILDCEVWEIFDALINGDTANAVEECYDAIAVLLRTIYVLEGRQKLGKPETKGAE